MINPAQIPTEAVEAAVNAYAGAIWDADAKPIDYRRAMTAAITAAINAWPKMTVDGETYKGVTDWHIHLPLKEYSDD